MASYPQRAVKKIKNDIHREIAAGILIAYGLFPRTNEGISDAQRLIAGRETWLAPSDLPDYYDNIESDLMTGKDTPGIKAIRKILKEFYGLDNKPVSTPKLKPSKVEVVKPAEKKETKPTKREPTTGETQIYKPDDKFVDDIQEELKEKLEETSDEIMDAIDELIAAEKKRFEDFKKKQQEELEAKRKAREGVSDQYSEPIGPDPMQGPKEPPKRTPKKTVAPENDEDWESEVPDQLGTKLDELIEQVQNEPLPQPTGTKRKKTKGKKPVTKKKAGGRKVGLGGTLEEIQENVTETKNALFEMYKIDKKRFEFRKKVDSQLTTMLKAKQAEARLEKEDDEDDKKKGFFTKIGDEVKNGIKEGLVAGLVMMLLPVVTDILRPFFNRDPETEGENQWWDPLDLIPNPRDMGEEKGEGTVGDEKIQPADKAIEPKASEEPQVKSPEATPEPVKTPTAPKPPTLTAPTPSPIPMRDTSIPGDPGYQKSSPSASGIPFRTAATGGRFDNGNKQPLRPINQSQVNLTEIKNKTKPLMAATMLPAKVGTLGLLSIAKNIITPFAGLIPEDGRTFIQNVFRETASMAGIDGYQLDFGSEESIWDAIKKMIFGEDKDDKNKNPSLTPPSSSGGNLGNVNVTSDEEEYLLRLLNAEAGGEGEIGMAAVARSVLNRAGLIQSGKVNAGMFMAESGSIMDVINAKNQYQPVREGKLERELTPEQRAKAMKALEMARNTASLRANLEAQGMSADQINNIMASTGFRTGDAFNDSSQNVNRTKLGNHVFNTAGNKDMITPSAKMEEPLPAPSSALPLQPIAPTSERPSIEPGETFMDKVMRMAGQRQAPTPAPSAPPKVPTINTKTGTFSSKSTSSRLAASQPSY